MGGIPAPDPSDNQVSSGNIVAVVDKNDTPPSLVDVTPVGEENDVKEESKPEEEEGEKEEKEPQEEEGIASDNTVAVGDENVDDVKDTPQTEDENVEEESTPEEKEEKEGEKEEKEPQEEEGIASDNTVAVGDENVDDVKDTPQTE